MTSSLNSNSLPRAAAAFRPAPRTPETAGKTGAEPPEPEAGRCFAVVSALCYSLVCERLGDRQADADCSLNAIANFVYGQLRNAPDFLRFPLRAATHAFDLWSVMRFGRPFHALPHAKRLKQIRGWRASPLGPQRDLVKFYESFATLAFEDGLGRTRPTPLSAGGTSATPVPRRQRSQVVVVGSGPGGSLTACLLAEAGLDVLLLEEGPWLPMESCRPFSVAEMVEKYRNRGATAALGTPKIAYVEGCCVGGGSEINSGLYHRTPPEVLADWRRQFQVEHLRPEDLAEHFEAVERDLSVGLLPGPAPVSSLKLHEGAEGLGWQSLEVPRWIRYDGQVDRRGVPVGARQSMTRTYIPRALAAGCRLQSATRAERIERRGGGWRVIAGTSAGQPCEIEAEAVFLACGAVHTPALLQRSGLSPGAGASLAMHPTVKLVAEFPGPINSETGDVGVHQVRQFAPRFSFGCSIGSRPYAALALLDQRERDAKLAERWRNMAVYYAMITGRGRGSVRTLPGFRDPLVRYRLEPEDLGDFSAALEKLATAVFHAGAMRIYPSVAGAEAIENPGQLARLGSTLPRARTNVMTIHLFSSCPMGEDRSRAVTDSFGRVHGEPGLRIADGSLLCGPPGVNPQGSIMAIARRNVLEFLSRWI